MSMPDAGCIIGWSLVLTLNLNRNSFSPIHQSGIYFDSRFFPKARPSLPALDPIIPIQSSHSLNSKSHASNFELVEVAKG